MSAMTRRAGWHAIVVLSSHEYQSECREQEEKLLTRSQVATSSAHSLIFNPFIQISLVMILTLQAANFSSILTNLNEELCRVLTIPL